MSDFLDDLRAANVLRQMEYDPDKKYRLLHRSNELAGEVGEICNIVKKLEREQLGLVGSRSSYEDLDEEIADALISLDLLAMEVGTCLRKVTTRKFNQSSKRLGLRTFLSRSDSSVSQTSTRRGTGSTETATSEPGPGWLRCFQRAFS